VKVSKTQFNAAHQLSTIVNDVIARHSSRPGPADPAKLMGDIRREMYNFLTQIEESENE